SGDEPAPRRVVGGRERGGQCVDDTVGVAVTGGGGAQDVGGVDGVVAVDDEADEAVDGVGLAEPAAREQRGHPHLRVGVWVGLGQRGGGGRRGDLGEGGDRAAPAVGVVGAERGDEHVDAVVAGL